MAGSRLLSLCGKTASSALSVALHRLAFLAGGDAVSVALQDFLGNPSNEGGLVGAVELLQKLRFKLFDVCHAFVRWLIRIRPFCVASLRLRTLNAPAEVTGWASAVERIRPGWAGATLTGRYNGKRAGAEWTEGAWGVFLRFLKSFCNLHTAITCAI